MSEQNTGRYSVGQEIIGINFCYEGRKIAGVLIPYIYNDEKPSRIVFNKLTVTEHHKVPWDQDSSENPEKKYDGYKLIDPSGRIWTNQYPRASYGQTSDGANYQFNPELKEGETWKSYWESDETCEFLNVVSYYGNLMRGVAEFDKDASGASLADQEWRALMRTRLAELKAEIDKRIKTEYGLVFKSKPLYNGSKTLTWYLEKE